ncbi:hypothetical protein [Bacillus taeanensis]|uniref:Uncharacterized protein n=1 Tax=Bacillus taeanensis TaxID=273032 RepID=A0A366XR88_9BACI|nr:hypothetical protein [Bacillus taeanensis]RBW68850.1 hypothetical protein DS031_14015 [Bacillus taeanensis]
MRKIALIDSDFGSMDIEKIAAAAEIAAAALKLGISKVVVLLLAAAVAILIETYVEALDLIDYIIDSAVEFAALPVIHVEQFVQSDWQIVLIESRFFVLNFAFVEVCFEFAK